MWYGFAADLTVLLHFAFILFVVFGAWIARKRLWLRWVHLAAMGYALLIEVFNWYCPLTHVEQFLRRRGKFPGYEGSFIPHYLDRLIYLEAPQWSLIVGASLVLIVNLVVYARAARRAAGSPPISPGDTPSAA